MTTARVAHESVDVAVEPTPAARVAHESIDVLVLETPGARVTGEFLEVVVAQDTGARVTAALSEVVFETSRAVRVTQEYLDVVSASPKTVRVTQAYLDVVSEIGRGPRVGTLYADLIGSVPAGPRIAALWMDLIMLANPPITGSADVVLGATGDLSVVGLINLDGSAGVVTSVSADLSVIPPVLLDGQADVVTATPAAPLQGTVGVAGSSDVVLGVDATIHAFGIQPLDGVAAVQTTATGNFLLPITLSGTAAVVVDVPTPSFSVTAAVSGQADMTVNVPAVALTHLRGLDGSAAVVLTEAELVPGYPGAYLNYWPPPANDNFEDAITIVGPGGSVTGSNKGGTLQVGEPAPDVGLDGPDGRSTVWYRWVAPSASPITFNLRRPTPPPHPYDWVWCEGQGMWMVLAGRIPSGYTLPDGVVPPDLTALAPGGQGISLLVVLGTSTYDPCVQWNWDIGSEWWNEEWFLYAPPVGNETHVYVLLGGPNYNLTDPEPTWNPALAVGEETLLGDPSPDDFDTVLHVFTGPDLANLTLVAADDDSGESTDSRLTFTPVEGTTYWIRVNGYGFS